MKNQEKLLSFLKANYTEFYCADCLSDICNIYPRQTIFQLCSSLYKQRVIAERNGICTKCKDIKKVYFFINHSTVTLSYYNYSKEETDASSNLETNSDRTDKNLYY